VDAPQLIKNTLPEEYQKQKACIKVIQVQEEINVGVNKKGYPAEMDYNHCNLMFLGSTILLIK